MNANFRKAITLLSCISLSITVIYFLVLEEIDAVKGHFKHLLYIWSQKNQREPLKRINNIYVKVYGRATKVD